MRIGENQQIKLDQDLAFKVLQSYNTLRMANGMQPQLVSRTFAQIENTLDPYVEFVNSAKIALGQVTIGKPILLTGDEAELDVPEGLASIYHFYVVIFAVSMRDDLDSVETINFSVSLPEGCVAFDLFPLRYGLQVRALRNPGHPARQ